MKSTVKLLAVVAVLMLAVSSLAGNLADLRISNDVTVGGAKLAAGNYKVRIDGNGPDVKVIFEQSGKVKATVNGTFQEQKEAPEYSSVVTVKTAEGYKVDELRLAKTKGYVKF
ncbi:MAG: hypothetical protein ROO76_01085 [Terriglobia bacterium]|jgi:hypothetical protein|nr:hypothetical protein [Terriglobia bacterium]